MSRRSNLFSRISSSFSRPSSTATRAEDSFRASEADPSQRVSMPRSSTTPLPDSLLVRSHLTRLSSGGSEDGSGSEHGGSGLSAGGHPHGEVAASRRMSTTYSRDM